MNATTTSPVLLGALGALGAACMFVPSTEEECAAVVADAGDRSNHRNQSKLDEVAPRGAEPELELELEADLEPPSPPPPPQHPALLWPSWEMVMVALPPWPGPTPAMVARASILSSSASTASSTLTPDLALTCTWQAIAHR